MRTFLSQRGLEPRRCDGEVHLGFQLERRRKCLDAEKVQVVTRSELSDAWCQMSEAQEPDVIGKVEE